MGEPRARAGQFAVPAVGLLFGFIAVAEKLREFEDELTANLVAERERARASAGARRDTRRRERRERIRGRMQTLIDGFGLNVAFQPIVDLASGHLVGAEALLRFHDPEGSAIPTERCFLDAHAVDMGVPLEMAVIRRALRLQSTRAYREACCGQLDSTPPCWSTTTSRSRSPPRTDTQPPAGGRDHRAPAGRGLRGAERLARPPARTLDVRVAVDDVGSGFASFRHVTRVNPDILKLDRTLVCGIDDDPVRQSLASAIVAFAFDVGAVVVSEGIENESELCFFEGPGRRLRPGLPLARPNLGTIDADIAQLTLAA